MCSRLPLAEHCWQFGVSTFPPGEEARYKIKARSLKVHKYSLSPSFVLYQFHLSSSLSRSQVMQVFLNLVLDLDHLSSYFRILLESDFYFDLFSFSEKKFAQGL